MRIDLKIPLAGFALISILLAVAIIAIMVALYFGKSGSNTASVRQTGQKAVDQTKENNALQLQQQTEIQNQLNSVDR